MQKFVTKNHFDRKFNRLTVLIAKSFEDFEIRIKAEMREIIKDLDVRGRVNSLERRVDRLELRKK